MSNVRYVKMIKLALFKVALFKVALFKVTSDTFLEVDSDWVSM